MIKPEKWTFFGRLPNEVLEKINKLFALPEIDVIHNDKYQDFIAEFIFHIKCQAIVIELELIAPYFGIYFHPFDQFPTDFYEIKHDNIFINFINNLSNNIDCVYQEGGEENLFKIEMKGNQFIITTKYKHHRSDKIYLHINNKSQLISAMKQYHNLMKTFIKEQI